MIKRALFFLILCSLVIPSTGESAQISFSLGDVSLVRKGKSGKVAMGQKLQNGDMLKTGKAAMVEVSYDDGSKIRIKENSTAQIGSKNIPGSDNVSLVSGDLTASFSKLLKGGGKTYSPTVVCAVRGTEYTMSVSKGGDTRIDLKEGKVQMNNPLGQLSLHEGEIAVADMSEAPQEKAEGSTEEWISGKDELFDDNPSGYSEKMSDYIGELDENAKQLDTDIEDQNKSIGKETEKEKIIRRGAELQNLSEKSEDEMMLSEATGSALERIVNQYKDTKVDLYNQFLKVKEESNKVMEQQISNQKALAQVKEAYKKAYDKIMGTYHKDFDRIINDKNFQKVLPDMNDFNE